MVPCMFLHHVEVTVPVQLTESPNSHSLLLFILMGGASEWGGAYRLVLMHMLNSYYAGEESVAQHCCHSNQHWQQLLASLVWLVVKVAPLLCAGHRTTDAFCTQNRHEQNPVWIKNFSYSRDRRVTWCTFCSSQTLYCSCWLPTFTLTGEVQAQDVRAICVQVVQILQVLLHSAVRQSDLNKWR